MQSIFTSDVYEGGKSIPHAAHRHKCRYPNGYRSVKGPVDFGSHAGYEGGVVPAVGEHTEMVLRAAGYEGPELAALVQRANAKL